MDALTAQIGLFQYAVRMQRIRLAFARYMEHTERDRMAQPADHFKGLVATLRQDIKSAIGDAQALKSRGTKSMSEFKSAKSALSGIYDEVDAATAEINGALLGDNGSNGGEPLDETKNSSAASPVSPATPSTGDQRAFDISDIHPSLRRQNPTT